MRAAGDQRDVVALPEQPAADDAADRARTVDDEPQTSVTRTPGVGLVAAVDRDQVGDQRLDLVGVAQPARRTRRASPGMRPASACTMSVAARSSPSTSTSVSISSTSGSSRTTAETWWKAAVTRRPAAAAAACWAALPSSTRQRVGALLVEAERVDAVDDDLAGELVAQRLQRRARGRPTARRRSRRRSRAHAALSAPRATPSPELSAAACWARSALREPMITLLAGEREPVGQALALVAGAAEDADGQAADVRWFACEWSWHRSCQGPIMPVCVPGVPRPWRRRRSRPRCAVRRERRWRVRPSAAAGSARSAG